jgi:hypothetical protein
MPTLLCAVREAHAREYVIFMFAGPGPEVLCHVVNKQDLRAVSSR